VFAALTVTSSFSEGKFTQQLQGVYRPLNGTKNAPVDPRSQTILSTGNTVEQTLASTERDTGDNNGSDEFGTINRDLSGNTPRRGVTTNNEKQSGVVVEIVPNNLFPDDDAGIPFSP